MRFLADFVMQSRSRALGTAVVFAIFPLLYLLSCAVVALVWLRMGRKEGLPVLLVALVPGVYYLVANASWEVLVSLLCTALFADLLRQGQSWVRVFSLLLPLGCGIALFLPWLPLAEQQQLIAASLEMFSVPASETRSLLEAQLLLLLNGMITAVQLLLVMLALFLGRWWQAQLYNPGGFQAEFHTLRMPVWMSGLMLLGVIAYLAGFDDVLRVLPVIGLPLSIAGVALVHGVFGIKNYNSFWLGLLYVALLFLQPNASVLLVLLAMADSLLNFRLRLAAKSSNRDDGAV